VAALLYVDRINFHLEVNMNSKYRMYDIVSCNEFGSRQHDPVAFVLGTSEADAMHRYAANPTAFHCKRSGEDVPGLTLIAYETHCKKFNEAFVLMGRAGVLGIYYVRDLAMQAMLDRELAPGEVLKLVANDYPEEARVRSCYSPYPWVVAVRDSALES
jgi:hypothetical protein